jgi:hypothetical protein
VVIEEFLFWVRAFKKLISRGFPYIERERERERERELLWDNGEIEKVSVAFDFECLKR